MRVMLKPSAFSDDWKDKPTAPLPVGIKILSEGALAKGRSTAVAAACKAHPQLDERSGIWIDAYNQALMHYAIAEALCQPDDVDSPLWEMQQDTVPYKLSESGTARLWDAIVELKLIDSPLSPEIDGDGLTRLVALVGDEATWSRMRPERRRALRRLLSRALDWIDVGETDKTG